MGFSMMLKCSESRVSKCTALVAFGIVQCSSIFFPCPSRHPFFHQSDWNRSSKDLFHPPFKYTTLFTVETSTAQMVYKDSSLTSLGTFSRTLAHLHWWKKSVNYTNVWWSKWPVQHTNKRDIKVFVWVSVRTHVSSVNSITLIKANVSPLQADHTTFLKLDTLQKAVLVCF